MEIIMKIDMIIALILIIVETLVNSDSSIVNTRLGRIQGSWKKSRIGRLYQEYLGIPYALPPVGKLRFEPIVNTRLGRIQGSWKKSRIGRLYQEYLGIPYALPPVGELRFEPPQRVAPWKGVLLAKNPASPCLQYSQGTATDPSRVQGIEDCLYLNVFASVGDSVNHRRLLPVIIFIYGGGLQMGEALDWGPKHLMDKDLIYVSFNHRLGPFGFLSTEDSVVPGNMGFKDQSFAIKWVSENIHSFGGDPYKVTLAGMSSGAASVHYHYLSPMSRGLFHRIIMGSGTALNCWAQSEASLEKAKKLGTLMKCPTSDNREMIKCLKNRRGESIAVRVQDFMPWRYNPFVVFGPVVEKNSSNPFIDKSPIEIIDSGELIDLPWLLNTDTEEGLFPASDFIFNEKRMKHLDNNWESIAPHILDYNHTIPLSDHAIVANKIRNFYMGDKRIEFSNAADFVRMVGDRLFALETGKFIKKIATLNNNPIWYYQFGYRGEYSISEQFGGTKDIVGVGHGDERYYIFSIKDCDLHNETDIQMSTDLVNLWASFATTGIPDMGVDWPPVERWTNRLKFLLISAPGQLRLGVNDDYGEKDFWSTIDFNENKLSLN